MDFLILKEEGNYNEQTLLKAIEGGNKEAFSIFFRRYSNQLYYVALRYTGNGDDAEEIVQEVFTRIWLHRDQIKADLPVIPYLVKITRNLLINKAKKRLHELAYRKYSVQKHMADKNNHTEEMVLFEELEQIVVDEVEHFPPKRKKIFKMSREKGMSTREIAEQLNISVSTVENQMNTALKVLKQKLKYTSYL